MKKEPGRDLEYIAILESDQVLCIFFRKSGNSSSSSRDCARLVVIFRNEQRVSGNVTGSYPG